MADARSTRRPRWAPVRFFNPIAMRFAQKATREDINDVLAAHAMPPGWPSTPASTPSEIHLRHNIWRAFAYRCSAGVMTVRRFVAEPGEGSSRIEYCAAPSGGRSR